MLRNKKIRVWVRDKNICFYCHKKCTPQEVSVDHVIPRWKGGTHDMENLVTSCKECNQKKGVKEEIIKYKK